MIEIQRKILALAEAGRAFAVATVAEARGSVPGKPGAKLVVEEGGACTGTVGGAGLEEKVKALCRKALAEGKGGLHSFDLQHYKEGGLDSLCGGSVTVFVEVHAPGPHLLVCGGGHCGLEVARLAVGLGWGVSVLDDRAEYADPARFPGARRTIHAGPEAFFASEDLSPYTHVLLVGWSHRVDTELLFHLAGRFPRWIGLVASKSKRAEMFRRLKARGLTDAQLDRVAAPVGLPIGAETPAEIAVSIAAQIISQVRKAAVVPAGAP
jgi:xanthine dehydrogenase accessory factor